MNLLRLADGNVSICVGNSKQMINITGFFCKIFQFLLAFSHETLYKLKWNWNSDNRKMKCKVSSKFMVVCESCVWNIPAAQVISSSMFCCCWNMHPFTIAILYNTQVLYFAGVMCTLCIMYIARKGNLCVCIWFEAII